MKQLTYFEIASGKIDRRRGVIKGCAVITVGEAKGHGMRVDLTTLEQVMDCANEYVGGLGVRFAEVDHGGGIANVIGSLRNWRIDGDTLRADLYLLKAHQDYELVMEMAATMPEAFGLSIVFSGVHEETETGIYARCAELYGCDVVKNPAANPTGLFSAPPVDTANPKESDMNKDEIKKIEVEFAQTSAALKDAETKLAANADEITALKAERDQFQAKMNELAVENGKSVDALQAAATELNALKAQVTDLTAKLEASEQSVPQRVADEIAKLGVPPIDNVPAKVEPTKDELMAEYARLAKTDGTAARAFWLKHENKLQDPRVLLWKQSNR
jgi:hypothetical protein